MKLKLKWLLSPLLKSSLFLFVGAHANAFPDLVRHGYASCTACHVSPSGGGLTTAYGRSLSKELLSTWGTEGEERFLYSVTPPEGLNVGGDIRGIQTYVNDSNKTQTKSFFMQSDLEVAVSVMKIYADMTIGVQQGPAEQPRRGKFLSRRYYLGYKPTDETSIRAGRFYPAYGLNFANHRDVTRRYLGFDEGQETDNVEASYSGEKVDVFVTGILGRTDDYPGDWRRGEAISASYFLFDRFKIGDGFMHTARNAAETDMANVYGILGFSKSLYMLSEFDLEWVKDLTGRGVSPHGSVSYQQLNYEFIQGMHAYLVDQIAYQDYTTPDQRFDSYGLGFQFFPRPHVDAELEYDRQREGGSLQYYDYAWLMLHYYL